MRTKNEILENYIVGKINPNEFQPGLLVEILVDIRDSLEEIAMLGDIRDSLVEIEKRLTEIGGQFEDIGGEARMNMRIAEHNER